MMCNIWLKFGKLWSLRQAGRGRLRRDRPLRPDRDRAPTATPRVARAVDRAKDQSYVLFGLGRELLPHVLFPVGGFPKAEIRAMARELGLPVHDKPDSQEICFVPDDDYLGFVRGRRPERETAGAIVDEDGHRPGRASRDRGVHDRPARGLGIAFGEPRYVVQIEPAAGRSRVGRRESLEKAGLVAVAVQLARARTRRTVLPAWPRSAPSTAPSPPRSSRSPDERARVVFDDAQPAITPGQVVTVYQDDLVLGGGWIEGAIDDAAASGGPAE